MVEKIEFLFDGNPPRRRVVRGRDVAHIDPYDTPPGSLDASWEAMIDSLTFVPANYIANCDTIDQWYEANTGYDTDGWTIGDLTPGNLDVRGQSGTQANPLVIEGIRGGPARWDGNWITFRRCLVEGVGTYAAYASPTFGSGTYGIRFEDCTFLQSPAVDQDCVLVNSQGGPGDPFGVSFYRCDIAGFGGGLKAYGGMWAKYCYIHHMQESSSEGQHVTCSTARGDNHHVIRTLGTDGGSGMFNSYYSVATVSNLLWEECIAIGMSPNASGSYGWDSAHGDSGFAAQSVNMRWIDCMCGKITTLGGSPPTPDPDNYAGIQYAPFSSTEGQDFGPGGNAVKEGCFMIEDGVPF